MNNKINRRRRIPFFKYFLYFLLFGMIIWIGKDVYNYIYYSQKASKNNNANNILISKYVNNINRNTRKKNILELINQLKTKNLKNTNLFFYYDVVGFGLSIKVVKLIINETKTETIYYSDQKWYNSIFYNLISLYDQVKTESRYGILNNDINPKWQNPILVNSFFNFLRRNLYWILFIGIIGSGLVMNKKMMSQFSGDKFKSQYLSSGKKKVFFKDVAGIIEEKKECQEIVDYLKDFKKYKEMGARIPKGILLSGPPGIGKTLLAKAIAGEANVPFFAVSASSFEEIYVGLGSKKIRTLFSEAKRSAPAIIFIDEIDSIGRNRNKMGHSASDQSLNQLLTEMDGFNDNMNIIVIGATNLLDSLDQALLRPGRFDRIIRLSLPTALEREEILKLHANNKNISIEVDFKRIATRTPGFSGAQLENILNESAILAVRENKNIIDLTLIDEAIDRVVSGPAKKSKIITYNEKKIVSYHESGHAVIGLKLKSASKVQKITIIPRGDSGGYTVITPKEDTYYITKLELKAKIAGFLGGRAAEEIIFGKDYITTGSHDDLNKATNIAKKMLTNFGMSDKLGLGSVELDQNTYKANTKISQSYLSNFDNELKKLLDDSYELAKKIIKENRELLEIITNTLLVLETINAEDIEYIEKNLKMPPSAIKLKEQFNKFEEKAKSLKIKDNTKKELSNGEK